MRAIEQYRAFCLLALGRTAEADRAIEAVIAGEPNFHPADSDVSPRVRAAFADVRRRMLPGIIQQKYTEAKATYDRKNFMAASQAFRQVLDMMNDPDAVAAAKQSPLSDLKTLAIGFRDLAVNAAEPPPLPAKRFKADAPPPAPAAVPLPPPAIPNIYSAADPAGPAGVSRSGRRRQSRDDRDHHRRERPGRDRDDAQIGQPHVRCARVGDREDVAVSAGGAQRDPSEVPESCSGNRPAPGSVFVTKRHRPNGSPRSLTAEVEIRPPPV